MILGYGEGKISVLDHKMIQVVYGGSQKSVIIRKAKGCSDISGNYNEYDDVNSVEVYGISVLVRGIGGETANAVWVNEGFSYSVYASPLISWEEMTEIIRGLK